MLSPTILVVLVVAMAIFIVALLIGLRSVRRDIRRAFEEEAKSWQANIDSINGLLAQLGNVVTGLTRSVDRISRVPRSRGYHDALKASQQRGDAWPPVEPPSDPEDPESVAEFLHRLLRTLTRDEQLTDMHPYGDTFRGGPTWFEYVWWLANTYSGVTLDPGVNHEMMLAAWEYASKNLPPQNPA